MVEVEGQALRRLATRRQSGQSCPSCKAATCHSCQSVRLFCHSIHSIHQPAVFLLVEILKTRNTKVIQYIGLYVIICYYMFPRIQAPHRFEIIFCHIIAGTADPTWNPGFQHAKAILHDEGTLTILVSEAAYPWGHCRQHASSIAWCTKNNAW